MLSVIPPSAADAPHVASKHGFDAQVNTIDSDSEPETIPPEPRTVDELMRSRSRTDPDLPLISYPSSGIEYVDYTPRQLDVFAYRVAQKYNESIPQRTSSNEKPAVIGLLGPSNLEYLVTMLALTKLGHTVMFMSTRISQEAHASLLNATGSRHMVIDKSFADMVAALKRDNIPDLAVIPIAGAESYNQPVTAADDVDTRMDQHLDPEIEQAHVAWIIHSSGSTGLPKPIFQTQRAALKNYATNMNMRGFITLPLFHAHGIGSLFRAVDSRKQIHLYNAALPLAKQYLTAIIKQHSFEIFYGVPYVLNLLAEDEEGLDLLARFKIVMFGGSSCPDALGDRLTRHGVYLVSHYGSTETGQLMTSFRPRDDAGWDYLRPSDAVKPYLRFEDRGGGLFECVCLDGWPSKVASNRPDGAYATKDCFTRHPTLPDAWKYYCRLDDTLTLNNGEKANPLQLEGAARQCPLVDEAVMFGAGKARLGLALVLSQEGGKMSREAVLDEMFKAIEPAHATLPAYAKIDREMVLVLPADTQFRVTDKGTVIRQAFYKQFAREIEAMYEEKTAEGALVLDEPELRDFIRKEVAAVLGLAEPASLSDEQDFFGLGMDSLQTTRLRTAFVKQLDLGGKQLGLNCVFDYPSVSALAHHLYALRTGEDSRQISKEEEMQALIEKYSTFREHVPQTRLVSGEYVIVGDERFGVWNATEAVPLMLRSAVTLGALPRLDEWVRWLPVDVVARAFVEVGVGEGDAPAEVYNVVNPKAFHWTRELLPVLRECGLQFEEVEVGEWLERLKRSDQDPERNPPVKLVTFWDGKYGKAAQAEKEERKPEVKWETERVRKWSQAMASVDKPGKELMEKIVGFFLNEAWKTA
ncbi:AMP-dependent synthetase/ligase [Macrophomina phaseolina MS6]|uniref:AMP-dependent synthetase/ligase n=1 Tax=Macrophomina phaseolina (strain MS6) TaxID=1126212 RepID=K2RCD3_MACPH|nr:AMP-dependent synthetase/ligase [Macrophomina phaseolina MS6]